MGIFSRTLSVAIFIPLVACTTTGPTVVSATPTSVTYRIAPDRLAETRAAADRYCAGQGRNAQLDRVTPTGEGKSVAAFSCH